ncbi:hypothetical protein FA13DRAFT_682040 [Coprinellus micaceus]|uniref:Uncharacterized protein n=1 Tax=Coprinellus micaceus TaxID=71717 RepID=A0A4Y7T5R3_COPMI|nr:hypothetical protein FA13DRAFT_682040 [Coprinellus micaceus]
MNPTVARPPPRPQSIRTPKLKRRDCSKVSGRKVLYASNIPRRTPHFSSSAHATKQRDPNKTEMPSLNPLPLTPLQVSPLPPRPSRAPSSRTNALSGAPVNVPNSNIELDQETERGGNLQVPAGGGAHAHHPSQVRVSTDCDGPTQTTNDLDWGGLRAGIATRRRFSFIKHMDWSPLPQPPISCEHSKPPGGSLPSTPPSIREATPSGSICFALPSPRSPFAGVAASIIALGRRTRNLSPSEDREELFSKKATAHNSRSTSGDGSQKNIESRCRSSLPRTLKPSPAIHPDDSTVHDGTQCPPTVLADVKTGGVAVPSSAVSNVQTDVAQLDQEASLDFPSTASAIFPSLLSEPFDSSDTSLAKHFNDIDLASPAAQRFLRSTTPSLESLDALVRYMLEGDVDLLHSSFVKGDGRHSRERAASGERAHSPASVTSAGLSARLESTPKSANLLHRGPRRSVACDSAFRVGVSNLSLLDEGMTESWPRTEHRGPKRDTPISREDLTDSMDLALANFKFCDNFGPTTSLLAPSLRIMGTPSPARRTTHFRLRLTDDEKRAPWKF